MSITKIKKQFARTESMLRSADSQRVHLWDMLLPYMSEEFHDESCYIDVAHGDGLVVVFENKLRFVRNYPVSQIIDLIEEGVTCITPDQLIAI
jgi:hypothetical protein